MSTTEPISLAEMARRLGWSGSRPGRRLLRYLKRREAELGCIILVKSGDAAKSPWRVTEAMVRKRCPELVRGKADAVRDDVAKFLGRIDERIAERVASHVEEHVDPQLEELRQVGNELQKGMRGLAERIEMILGTTGK